MNTTQFYQVSLAIGDHEDISWRTIFVTDMEYKAKWYCSKANDAFKKHHDYYFELMSDVSNNLNENFEWTHIQDRLDLINGLFVYNPVTLRTNFKISQ